MYDFNHIFLNICNNDKQKETSNDEHKLDLIHQELGKRRGFINKSTETNISVPVSLLSPSFQIIKFYYRNQFFPPARSFQSNIY